MMEELLKSPDRLGGVLILAGMVVAFIRGDIVPRYVLKREDDRRAKIETECAFYREGWLRQVQMTDRSLHLAERTTTKQETP